MLIQHFKYRVNAYLITNHSHVKFLFLGCLFIFIGISFISLLYFWNNATSNCNVRNTYLPNVLFSCEIVFSSSVFFFFQINWSLSWYGWTFLCIYQLWLPLPQDGLCILWEMLSQFKVQGYVNYHRRLLRVQLQWGLLQELANFLYSQIVKDLGFVDLVPNQLLSSATTR